MSRRRAKKPPSALPDAVTVAVVCTGRRTHPEVNFGSMIVHTGGTAVSERLKVAEHFNGLDFDAQKTLKTIPFVCRRCRPARNAPLKRETLDAICLELASAGTPRLDLSALGAILG